MNRDAGDRIRNVKVVTAWGGGGEQVQKVRLLLREYDLDSVRVGTVDDYQGQEEKVPPIKILPSSALIAFQSDT